MWEFNAKKEYRSKEQILTIGDGKLKTANELGNISTGQNSLKLGKTPYFQKVSKIREIVYFSEGVCVSPRVLPELAQRSVQSRVRRSSGAFTSPTFVDIGGTGSGGPIFLE